MNIVYCVFADEKKLYDLKYIFEEEEIEFVAIERKDIEYALGHLLVICSENRDEELEYELKQKNMQIYRDYMYISDFTKKLNYLFWKKKNRPVLIWGAGNKANEVLEKWEDLYPKDLIHSIVDNNCSSNRNQMLHNVPVVHPSMIHNWENYMVIIAVLDAYGEIEQQLVSMGLKREVNYIGWNTAMIDASRLFLKTFFDNRHTTDICKLPFGFVDIIGKQVYCCCPSEVNNISLGNLEEVSFKSAWHSVIARIIRCSIINGTYSFCDEKICEARFELKKENTIKEYVTPQDIAVEEVPQEILIGLDYTCNLYCPSCRNQICVADSEKLKSARKIADELISEVHEKVNRLWLAGSGEVFASKIYRELLVDKRVIDTGRIAILSNGTLFSKENYEKYISVYKNVDVILSIDGARKETIEKLRRGSSYEILAENFKNLGDLRRRKIIKSLQINFVLQAANVSELKEMIAWCEQNCVDRIKIHKLINTLNWTKEEYIEKGVIDENNEIKEEYRKYFDEEVLQHPICDWAMMKNHVDGAMRDSLFGGEYTVIM